MPNRNLFLPRVVGIAAGFGLSVAGWSIIYPRGVADAQGINFPPAPAAYTCAATTCAITKSTSINTTNAPAVSGLDVYGSQAFNGALWFQPVGFSTNRYWTGTTDIEYINGNTGVMTGTFTAAGDFSANALTAIGSAPTNSGSFTMAASNCILW